MIAIHHFEQKGLENIFKKYDFLLLQYDLPKVKDICLHELGCLAMNFESFLFSNQNITCNQNHILVKLAELIVGFGLVKTFEGCEDREFDEKDFPYEAANAKLCFQYLDCLLNGYYFNYLDVSSKRSFIVQALLLCATHNQKYLWSNENSVTLCQGFLINLLIHTKYESLSTLLTDETFHPTIFKGILKWMRPTLMKDTWMKNPSACHVFYWLLGHVQHPHLEEYLPQVIPPSFMFCSYYMVPQQVIGIKCFSHIIGNVSPCLLKLDGTDQAIFDALKRYLYSKEKPIIDVLYECISKLPVKNLQKVGQTQWMQHDVVVQQLLENISMESDPKIRYLFLYQLYLFIKDKPIFKHLKKTLNVVYDNLGDNSDEEENCRSVSLEIVKELLRNCWPRMEHHCHDILLAVLKVICDIQNFTDVTTDSAVLNVCVECLFMLKNICPEKFMSLANDYVLGSDELTGPDLLPGTDLLTRLIED